MTVIALTVTPPYDSAPGQWKLQEIEEYQKKEEAVKEQILTGSRFKEMIATHKGLRSPEEYNEKFLDDPKYFSALLIFCQSMQISIPVYLRELIGAGGRLPRLDTPGQEQGKDGEYRENRGCSVCVLRERC